MEYLFTEKNRNLEQLRDAWIAGDKLGAYVLAGKSGSGKTAFLQHLDRKWQEMCQKNMITWMRVEEFVATLLEKEEVFANVKTPVLVLENMEELLDKENTLSLFWSLLEVWLQDEQRLFVGVTNNENIMIPHYVEVVRNQEIEITPKVVSYVAHLQDVCLGEDRIVSLCNESESSVSKLIGLVKREKLFTEMN